MIKKLFIIFFIIISLIPLCMLYQNKIEITNMQEFYEIPANAREICSHNNCIYYIIDENNFINILKFDILNQDTETIYKYNTEDNINIIELYAIDNYVIWVENPVDYKWKIIKYNLTNKEKKFIRTFEQSNKSFIPTCLSTDNNFLAWYESTYNDKNKLEEILIIYDTKTNEIMKKNIYLFGNPYLRPYIRNNYISYIVKENASYYINVCNLITGENKKIDCISSVAKIMSNGDYIVWLDDFDSRNIYIYDNQNRTYRKIDGSLNPFTFELINNTLYISYSKDSNGYANIYSLDLKTNKRKNVTKNNNENINFYLAKPNTDNRLLFEKIENVGIKIFLED